MNAYYLEERRRIKMITEKQRNLAKKLQKMHKTDGMFVLPNIWSAGSAYIFEKQGFKAIATTSAGIAYELGYPDGEEITLDDVALIVKQIVRRVEIPLSVDFERGYADTVEQVKSNARKLLKYGAVGLNIEDGRSDGTLDELGFILDKIKALVELKNELDLDFVINARTCTYWLNVANEETKMKIALERGNAFRKAGVDCVFIPGEMDEKTVKKLIEGIDSPVNILLNQKFHNFKNLEEIGVRRLSVGSGLARISFKHLIKLATDLQNGEVEGMFNHTFSYGEANQYFIK